MCSFRIIQGTEEFATGKIAALQTGLAAGGSFEKFDGWRRIENNIGLRPRRDGMFDHFLLFFVVVIFWFSTTNY